MGEGLPLYLVGWTPTKECHSLYVLLPCVPMVYSQTLYGVSCAMYAGKVWQFAAVFWTGYVVTESYRYRCVHYIIVIIINTRS